jgi:hypothetical protein
MSRFVIPSLIVAATLIVTICWEAGTLQSGTSGVPGHSTPPTLASIISVPTLADPVEAWVTTSLERPLLRESRRPDKTAGDTRAKGDDILRLAAVMTGPFGNRAIFMVPGNAKPVVAKVGEQVSDFVVRSIEPGRVVVEVGGIVRTYRPIYSRADRNSATISIRS